MPEITNGLSTSSILTVVASMLESVRSNWKYMTETRERQALTGLTFLVAFMGLGLIKMFHAINGLNIQFAHLRHGVPTTAPTSSGADAAVEIAPDLKERFKNIEAELKTLDARIDGNANVCSGRWNETKAGFDETIEAFKIELAQNSVALSELQEGLENRVTVDGLAEEIKRVMSARDKKVNDKKGLIGFGDKSLTSGYAASKSSMSSLVDVTSASVPTSPINKPIPSAPIHSR